MKKGILLLSLLGLTLTLTGCSLFRSDLAQHEKTLSKYDNYVLTLDSSIETSGNLTSNKVYYYVDNKTGDTCITTYNPNNLLDQDETGETPFGCIGIQLEIEDEMYYYDGLKAYLFADVNKASVENIFFHYFDEDDYTEEGKNKTYSVELTLADLEYEMKQIIGVSSISEDDLADTTIIISATYSESDNRFIEFKIDYKNYLDTVYTMLGSNINVTQAYTTFTYGYFDKKYTVDAAVPDSEIDDYPDSLGVAELVGYTIIEDEGSISGSFIDIDDSDIFQFDASGPNQYTFSITVPDGEIIEYTIADFNGSVIQIGYFDLVLGYTTSIELVSEGTYYIVINPYEGSIFPHEYTITID